ncbi:hypothetical protein [Salinibacter ruber]|uniref:hypothetical protein n=1 Tax=Salinibacter ruber TaxID=146919 RepID=UPI002072AEDE|nr:hypothetical protein [Salinibacter ruber]MCS4116187.1 hypothetical protein [Salinibacter ruber]MCS4181698.1 hypothetical protein [Salinibacter ruber]
MGTLDEPLLHYAFSKGIADWVERHNRYSTDEAVHAPEAEGQSIDWSALFRGDAQAQRRALKDLSYRLPCRPLLRFFYVYLWRMGVLDGQPGFDYAVLLSFYEYLIGLKRRERTRGEEGRDQDGGKETSA